MLELRNVSYVYSLHTPFEKTAVNDISFTVPENRTIGLIGHTGSGKSTVAQMMNALLKPTSGTVLLDGNDVHAKGYDTSGVRFKVGLVFQYPEYQLFEDTVYKDIAFGPRNMGLSDEEIDRRIRYAAGFVGIAEDLFEKSPFELSGGQKRRVAIAGVLAMQPEVLVLDEPAAGLDPRGRNDILSGLVRYRKERGSSLVIISHSMEDIALYADELVVLSGGKVLLTGTPKDVFSRHRVLHDAGLDVPEVTEILIRLREAGLPVGDDAVTVEEACAQLMKILI